MIYHDVRHTSSLQTVPPTADAGPDQTVNEGDTVTLDGSNSSDLDDEIASYQWTQTSGTSVTLSNASAVQPTFIAPDVGTGGESLTFQLTVTDQGGLQDTDSVTVNVTLDNDPPTADAGPDQTVNEGDTVTLDGSNSSDLDDGIASYLWEQTGGTSVPLSDPTAVQPTFTAPDVGPDGESLTFQLTVTDNSELQSTDTCVVNVIFDPDKDNDGLPDDWELTYFGDLSKDGTADSDNDGLSDKDEYENGTNPTNYDTDADDLPDGWEVNNELDPLDDTGNNGRDGDFDNDNWTNYQEYVGGSDPNDPESVPSNNAPTVPALNYPLNDGETTSLEPILSVSNSTDLDGHALIYAFELYSNQGLTSLVTSVSGVQEGENTTEWQVDTTLDDNSFYYWRARAYDGIDYSEWMDTAKFFVNTSNDAPSIPNVNMPPDNSEVTTLQPTLEVTNAGDVDLDPLTYEFELYSDQNMSSLERSKTGVLEGNAGATSWHVDISLQDNASYWWRAQARDNEDEPSGWTSLFTFSVNTANDVPTAPSISSPQDGDEVDTLEPALEVNNSTDADLDTLTYFFEIDKANTFDTSTLEQSPEVRAEKEITWNYFFVIS